MNPVRLLKTANYFVVAKNIKKINRCLIWYHNYIGV